MPRRDSVPHFQQLMRRSIRIAPRRRCYPPLPPTSPSLPSFLEVRVLRRVASRVKRGYSERIDNSETRVKRGYAPTPCRERSPSARVARVNAKLTSNPRVN